ncbi:MAG: hypothetical protein ACOH2K_15995 [Burkholderiaceae bacterium]
MSIEICRKYIKNGYTPCFCNFAFYAMYLLLVDDSFHLNARSNMSNEVMKRVRRLELPRLGKGWTYSPPVEQVLHNCVAQRLTATKPAVTPLLAKKCNQSEKILGPCGI